MKKLLGIAALSLVMGFGVYTGASAAMGPLTCFDGASDASIYGGNCTIAAGTATLNNNGGDPDGSYSGVYYPDDSLKGMLLSGITSLSFNYTGTPTAGSPRISLPVDTNNDGTTEAYAFVGSALCNNGAGLVDVINDPTCNINYLGVDYANWTAFLAAYPTAEVADAATFIIADDAGSWTVSNVVIGDAYVAPTPSQKDQCKDGGWKTVTGQTFKNQGQCVSYFAQMESDDDSDE